jgi:hypothetical protein
MRYSVRQITAVGIGLVVILAALLLAYNFLVFRVTKTNPAPNTFPSFVTYVDFYVSQPVAQVGKVQLNGNNASGNIVYNGKWLRYTHPSKFLENIESTLVIQGVRSQSGNNLDITYTFTPRYMDFVDVPKDLQKASLDKASSGQNNDPFFNNYFPMIDKDNVFEIELVSVENSGLYVTFYDEVFDYDTNQQTQLPNDQAEALRLKVLDYIRSRGGKPENYRIEYANRYLDQKYNPDDHSGE